MHRTSSRPGRIRLPRLVALVAAASAAAAATVALPPAHGAERAEPATATPTSATSATHQAGGADRLTRRELQRQVEQTLVEAGYVGLSVEVRDGRHRVRARAGEAELGTGRPVPRRGYIRAGSPTKTFVATVILQLVAEGRLSLDDTVEEWLPGVVTGNGHDGSRITVRHLLQQTSGIHSYSYMDDIGRTEEAFLRHRFDHVAPEQIVAGAMRSAPEFPPADPDDPEPDWGYSNPNYVLAGMIIREVTGRSWADEVADRIVRPLGLTGTYAPGDDPHLPEPHMRSYMRFPGSDSWTDTTVRNTTLADAAGAIVSTHRDLDRFYTALLTGRLLPEELLAEMRDTVPARGELLQFFPGLRYGLGLMQEPLTCGGHRWGHHGDIDGTTVRDGVTDDGRRSVVVAASGKTPDRDQLLAADAAVRRLVDTVLCRGVR